MNKSRVLLLLIPFLLLALFFVPASAATYDGAVWIDGNNEGDHIADFAVAAQTAFPITSGYKDILLMEPHTSFDQGITTEGFSYQITLYPGKPMHIDWVAPPGVVVYYVFIKASDGGWLYAYKDGATSDTYLASEKDSISHVSFYALTTEVSPTPPVDSPTPPVDTPTPPVDTPTPPEDSPTPPMDSPTPPVDTPTPPIDTPTPPDATITAEATLTEPPLPQTGGVDSNLMYLLGSGLVASGFLLRRRSKR